MDGSHTNAISAIQKYIRRSELTKALQCCLEADISYRDTQLNKGEYATSAQSNRSNFINRMIVSMVEDISINGRPDLPIIVQKIYVAYKALYSKQNNSKNKILSINFLMNLCELLSNSKKKSRIPSYLKSAFTLPPFYVDNKYLQDYYSFLKIQ